MRPASTLMDEAPDGKRRVLVIGGGLAGLAAARELRHQFRVTVVDAKEYFEFTSGIMRAYVQPDHWDSLTFLYHEVLERHLGVGFIWGEVTAIDSEQRCVRIKPMSADEEEVLHYDFCVIAGGCNFNQLASNGESPWFPTVHEKERVESENWHIDERYLEGRRRRILEEHQLLLKLEQQEANILIVGAGFMGVQWATELRHFMPGLRITVCDFLPRCLGPLPEAAAQYCEDYMYNRGIKTFYGVKYDKNSKQFWQRINLPDGAAKTYILSGVRHSNYFMDKQTLSERGPGGGGWILTNRFLQVVTRSGDRWGDGVVFAIGDCVVGSVGEAPRWELPPMPKTGFPAEHQAVHACRNIRALDKSWYGVVSTRVCGCIPTQNYLAPPRMRASWFPWCASVFVVSLGPTDGALIVGAKYDKGSGRLWAKGLLAASLKELIETTKVAHCRSDSCTAFLLWFLIHHFPFNACNMWGRGPIFSCW
eukprot:TRINITY_DN109386_c0_g1_i1.p1 TRINITY_DN109386_c0_g1~~TRINITY_DN109386_c0_g1_i1.p1  ORF type:complete len:486 (+),score=75.52 TRINITY_DN109386_c0_g1_i1:27-1460(+)